MKRNDLTLRITLSNGNRHPMYEQELNDIELPKNMAKRDIEGMMANSINTLKFSIPIVSKNKENK